MAVKVVDEWVVDACQVGRPQKLLPADGSMWQLWTDGRNVYLRQMAEPGTMHAEGTQGEGAVSRPPSADL